MKTAEIKYWLFKQGISQVKIVRETKKSPAIVSMTINGDRYNETVIKYLKNAGCPANYLTKEGC